jgi:hypothetical protein
VRVVLATTFRASRKEPLAEVVQRIHAAFLASHVDPLTVQFSFSDAPVPGFVSSVDRVLKRVPALERFTATGPFLPGGPPIRAISNRPGSPAPGEPVDFSILLTIAAGVPRSFPFHNLSIHFQAPAFGEAIPSRGPVGIMQPGVLVADSWWVNGRQRSVTAVMVVNVDRAGKKLPPPPDALVAVLDACGKAAKTTQIPLPDDPAAAAYPLLASPSPEAARAVSEVVRAYRSRFAEILERAALPHDLSSALEALSATPLGEATGPKKPVLVAAFKPMGYDCRGGVGTFTLRRRTPGNLTVELDLDVGTWSRSLTASFRVSGLGFSALLSLPVSKRAMDRNQYKIGDANGWRQIVENLAALVAELDRSFVPAVEAASGPSPEWFKPED